MRKTIKDYLNNDIVYNKKQVIGILAAIIVFAGIFGWIYEFLFYYANSGFKTFYYRGGNFFPWINIYATGSIMIIILTYKYKKNPFLVFVISLISTGLLEYFSGYIIYELRDGLRLWDYNSEILNFGNINGFICLRSVTFFGLSGLLLMYFVLPMFIFLEQKLPSKLFFTLSILLCSLILFDEFYNLIFARVLDLPRAHDVYESIGFKFMKYR